MRPSPVTDIGFVLSLSALYVVSRAFPSLAIACVVGIGVAVVAFAIIEIRRGVRSPCDAGLRIDTLSSSILFSSLFFAPFLIAGVIFAVVRGVYRPDHFLIALLVYPFWGLIQQTLFQGVFFESFRRLQRPYLGIVATSLLFVAVHYPSKILMGYTAIAGPLFSWIYHKRPNVLPLAFYHGVLGAFLYYVVRQKDVIGKILEE